MKRFLHLLTGLLSRPAADPCRAESAKPLTAAETEVLDGYLATVHVSAVPAPRLVAMVGLIGTFQSVVANQLAKKLRAAVVCGNEIEKRLAAINGDRCRVRPLVEEAAIRLLRDGRHAIIDADWIDRADRESLERKLAEARFPAPRYVRTTCEPEVMFGHVLSLEIESIYRKAPCRWNEPRTRPAVAKMARLVNRLPLHYEHVGEGEDAYWKLRELPFPIVATVDTTPKDEWRDDVDSAVRLISTADWCEAPESQIEPGVLAKV
jgi:predicted kinase